MLALIVFGLFFSGESVRGMEKAPDFGDHKALKKLWLRSEKDEKGWKLFNITKKVSGKEENELISALSSLYPFSFNKYMQEKQLDPNVIIHKKTLLGYLCSKHLMFHCGDEGIKYLLKYGGDPERKSCHCVVDMGCKILVSPLEYVCVANWNQERAIAVAKMLLQCVVVKPLTIELAQEESNNPGLVKMLQEVYKKQEIQ
jgi:hypothetical protein